jgi:hypothetical protein
LFAPVALAFSSIDCATKIDIVEDSMVRSALLDWGNLNR